MDREGQNNASNCPVCGGSRWWRSRTGARVCQQCYGDPFQDLKALADRVQGECDPAIDDQEERLAPGSDDESAQGRWEPRPLARHPARDSSTPCCTDLHGINGA
jgi:hypothetical protein